MASWPTTEELKARLDITSADWDDQLDRVLAAAVGQTKLRKGDWVEAIDVPDDALAQSALELAVEYGTTGVMGPASTSKSGRFLTGQRRRFPIG